MMRMGGISSPTKCPPSGVNDLELPSTSYRPLPYGGLTVTTDRPLAPRLADLQCPSTVRHRVLLVALPFHTVLTCFGITFRRGHIGGGYEHTNSTDKYDDNTGSKAGDRESNSSNRLRNTERDKSYANRGTYVGFVPDGIKKEPPRLSAEGSFPVLVPNTTRLFGM